MSESRLKIKFGEHEFEAEGSAESIERQLETFKRLVAPEPEPRPAAEIMKQPETDKAAAPVELERIMRIQGRTVSLSVSTKLEDAVLLMILGQRQFRQNHIVSGGEVMRGLRESGFRVGRADTVLKRHAGQGSIIAIGRYRTRRYQFSQAGLERAEQIARQLISQIQ